MILLRICIVIKMCIQDNLMGAETLGDYIQHSTTESRNICLNLILSLKDEV